MLFSGLITLNLIEKKQYIHVHQQANNLLFHFSVLFNFLPSLEKVKSGKVKKLIYLCI